MKKSKLTVKGQIVIPSEIRRKFGIKQGTQVFIYDRGEEIVIKPITDEYIRGMAGMAGTKGRLLRALKEGKTKDRAL